MNETVSHTSELVLVLVQRVPEWSKYVMTGWLALAFLLGVPGNAIVVHIHRGLPERSIIEWMIFYLALCDMMSLCVCVPAFIVTNLHIWNKFVPSIICPIHYGILTTCYLSSNIITAIVAVERYRKMSGKRDAALARQAKFLGGGVIILCLGLGSPFYIMYSNNSDGYCTFKESEHVLQVATHMLYLCISIACCVVIFICYGKVALKLKGHRRVLPSNANEQADTSAFQRTHQRTIKTTKMMALMSVVFLLSTIIPTITAALLAYLDGRSSVSTNTTIFFLSRLYFINNFANPILYFSVNESFRTSVYNIFRTSQTRVTPIINML